MPSLRERAHNATAEREKALIQSQAPKATPEEEREQVLVTIANLNKRLDVLRTASENAVREHGASVAAGRMELFGQTQSLQKLVDEIGDEELTVRKAARDADADDEEVAEYKRTRARLAQDLRAERALGRALTSEFDGVSIDSLLPGQLDAMIAEKVPLLEHELYTTALLHPDVDPELTKQIEKKVIPTLAKEIVPGAREHTDLQRGFYHGLYERAGGYGGGVHEKQGATLQSAVKEAVQQFSNDDKAMFLRRLASAVPNIQSSGPLEEAAIARALAEQMVFGSVDFSATWNIIKDQFVEEEKATNTKLDIYYEGEIGPGAHKDDQYDADKVRTLAAERLSHLPEVKKAAGELFEEYKTLTEYKNLERSVRTKSERESRLRELLSPAAGGRHEPERFQNRLELAERMILKHEAVQEEPNKFKEKIAPYTSIIDSIRSTYGDFKQPITLGSTNWGGDKIGFWFPNNEAHTNASTERDSAEAALADLRSERSRLVLTKDGMFGGQSGKTKERIAQLTNKLIPEAEKRFDTADKVFAALKQEEEKVLELLAGLTSHPVLSGKSFTGTIEDLLSTIKKWEEDRFTLLTAAANQARQEMPTLEQDKAKILEEQERARTELAQIDANRARAEELSKKLREAGVPV